MTARLRLYAWRTIVLLAGLGCASLLLAAGDTPDGPPQVFRQQPSEEITSAIESGAKYLTHKYPLDLRSGQRLVLAFAVHRDRKIKRIRIDESDARYLTSLAPDKLAQEKMLRTTLGLLAAQEMRTFGQAALPYLAEQMRATDRHTRRAAFGWAGGFMRRSDVFKGGKPEEMAFCTAVLMRSLLDEDPSVRGTAATYLGKLGVTSAVPELAKLLDGEPEGVRIPVAYALRALGREDLLPPDLRERIKGLYFD